MKQHRRCPFCGGEGHLERQVMVVEYRYRASCGKCGATIMRWCREENEAWEKWDERCGDENN